MSLDNAVNEMVYLVQENIKMKDEIYRLNQLVKEKDVEIERRDTEIKRLQQFAPKHGPCCTCQVCGKSYDDCRCLEDELHAKLTSLESELESERVHCNKKGKQIIDLENQLAEQKVINSGTTHCYDQTEHERLQSELAESYDLNTSQAKKIYELKFEIIRLNEIGKRVAEHLKKYGSHKENPCADFMGDTGKTCGCGLDEAIAGARKAGWIK